MYDQKDMHPGSPQKECLCRSDRGLFLVKRQLSFVVAGFILLLFCSFVTGYFVARRHTVEELCVKVEQESFADQVYASLCTLYDQEPEVLPTQYAQDEPQPGDELTEQSSHIALATDNQSGDLADTEEQRVARMYRAELIGFGTAKAAQQFASRLLKKGTPVVVRRRVSTTAKGKKNYWYQVVIDQYNDKEELSQLVEKIAKEERLKGTRIVAC